MLFWNNGNSVSISKLHLKSPYHTALLLIVFLCLFECVVRVAWRGLAVACRDLPITIFFETFGVWRYQRSQIQKRASIALNLVMVCLY